MVDGFRFQNANCKSYLLTHFHSDHTTGLTRGFTAGLIYCTPVTARYSPGPLQNDLRPPSLIASPTLPDKCIPDASDLELRDAGSEKGTEGKRLPIGIANP
jgi:Cft2 family RNA processing exonuclease